MEYLPSAFTLGVLICLILLFFILYERARRKLNTLEAKYLQLAKNDNFFKKKEPMIRKEEKAFFEILRQIVEDRYYVFPQVHLTELVTIKDNSRDHDNLYQMLGNKTVDFAFFTKDTMSPILVIELNGASHFAGSRQNKDQLKRELFQQAGIPFLSISVGEIYSEKTKISILSSLP